MVPVAGHFFPLFGHFAGPLHVFFFNILVAQQAGHVAVGSDAQNGFYRQVGVVGQMAGKVIGAQLVFRIQALFYQVAHPAGQGFPMFAGHIGLARIFAYGGAHNEHVTAFFHRHVGRISLAVGQREIAHVVGRIRFVPTAAFGKLEDGCQQSFGQGGVVFQEDRRGRIGHIDRSDKAAGIVLLGEPQQFTRGRLHQFVGCNGLPISQGAEFGILPAALFQRLLVEFQVEGAATAHQGLVFFVGQDELLFDAALPVAVPVRRQVLSEILEGVPAIVITQHDLARNSFHRRHLAHPVQVAIFHGGGPVFGRHQEAAPVDADIVPASCQRFLDRVRCLQPHQTVLFVRIQHRGFAHDIVQGPGGTGLQAQDHIVLFAVPRTNGIREVVDRAAQQVQVLHQQRSREIYRQLHRPAFEPIMGGGCLHVGHQLPRGLRPRLRLLVAHNQAKVQQGPADGIGTVGFQDVFSFFDQVTGNGNPLPLAALYL